MPEGRQELLRAVFERPDAGTGLPVFGAVELERMFAAALLRKPGDAPSGAGIDPEELTAFFEGVLSETDRDSVLRRLASDDKAFDQFLTVARFRLGRRQAEEAGEDGRQGGTAPAPSRHGQTSILRWLLPIAAGLILIVALPLLLSRDHGLPTAEELVARADGGATDFVPFELERPVTRNVPDDLDPEARAALFEAGVRTVDLAWLARRRGSRDQISEYVLRVPRLVEIAVSLPPDRYQALADSLAEPPAATPTPEQLAAAEAELTADLSDLDPPLYDFGRWTEATRLAAVAASESFFRDPETYARPLRRFRRAEPDSTVQGLLADLPDPKRDPLDYPAILGTLDEILEHCLGGGDCLG